MTKYDIKSYLEKIYQVPVANVKTVNKMGKARKNVFSGALVQDDDYKLAFVTLPPGWKFLISMFILKPHFSGQSFEWPDLKIKSQLEDFEESTKSDIDDAKTQFSKEVGKDSVKYRPGVPTFFGL